MNPSPVENLEVALLEAPDWLPNYYDAKE